MRQREKLLAEALRFAVRSAVDADGRRFQFPTERDRLQWAEHVAHRIRLAFWLAARVGDAVVVSDLIASARAAGLLEVAAGASEDGDELSRAALDVMLTGAASRRIADDGPGGSDPGLTAGGGVAVGLGLSAIPLN